MNIYEKLELVKLELSKRAIKKSGQNKFAGYSYFELADLIPHILDLFNEHKLCSTMAFDKEYATLTIIDSEKPEDFLVFTSPTVEITMKGCNEVQAAGAVQTYLRRYLFVNALDIVEADLVDSRPLDNEVQSKPKVVENNTTSHEVNNGKHKGKTLEQLMTEDIGYVKWIANKDGHQLQEVAKGLLSEEVPF